MFIIRLIVKTLLVLFALPALALVTVHGGIGTGIGTLFFVWLGSILVSLVLLPALLTGGVFSVLVGGALGGKLGAALVSFAIHVAIVALALAFAAWVLPGLALVGFWGTVGAAAILSLADVILD